MRSGSASVDEYWSDRHSAFKLVLPKENFGESGISEWTGKVPEISEPSFPTEKRGNCLQVVIQSER